MRSGFAGAAIAAVMTCAGWVGSVGGAEALVIDAYGGGSNSADGVTNFSLHFDSNGGTTATVDIGGEYFSFDPIINGTFYNAHYESNGIKNLSYSAMTYFGFDTLYLLSFTLVNPSFSFVGIGPVYEADTITVNASSEVFKGAGDIMSSLDVNGLGTQLTGVYISSVDLPPSAPLFGAALLIVGGVGYGRRRVKLSV